MQSVNNGQTSMIFAYFTKKINEMKKKIASAMHEIQQKEG